MLPKRERLSSEREIRDTINRKQYEKRLPLLYFTAKDNELGFSRLCVVTSKKLGKATTRNRIRRIFFQAFYEIMHKKAKKHVDMVIFPRSSAAAKKIEAIKEELIKALAKEKIC